MASRPIRRRSASGCASPTAAGGTAMADGTPSELDEPWPVWRPAAAAPRETTVIAWGDRQVRFVRQAARGQWRNMLHQPRQAPTFWPPLPPTPGDRDG